MNKQRLIRREVENYFDVDLLEQNKRLAPVAARHTYYRLMKEHTEMGTSSIARTLNRDHATVIHSLKHYVIPKEFEQEVEHCFKHVSKRVVATDWDADLVKDEIKSLYSLLGDAQKRSLINELSL